ncbi:hypothetical protein MTO96_010954, partial [Rhipicephalus appendiculatus]
MRLAFGALLVVALWSTSSLDGLSSKP